MNIGFTTPGHERIGDGPAAGILLDDVCTDDYDALAIPGGFEEYGFYEDAFSPKTVKLINDFNAQGKMIATICVAALALGNCGLLKGKRATTYHLGDGRRQRQLARYGAIVVNEPVVRTDNLVTSYCPQTGPAVAFTLLEELVGSLELSHLCFDFLGLVLLAFLHQAADLL